MPFAPEVRLETRGRGEGGAHRGASSIETPPVVSPDDRRLLAWKAYLDSPAAPPASLPSQLPSLLRSARRCAVVLYRGNHFSAAVFEVHPSRVADASQEEKFEALAHKSLHRYVVRAKAGGKQSSQDASGRFARSAGARLRRHNEAALAAEAQAVLRGWGELLRSCAVVAVSAPSSNWQQLVGGDGGEAGPPLRAADPRVRALGFPCRRPTFSETRRVLRILVSVYPAPEQAAEAGGAHRKKVHKAHKGAAGKKDKQEAPSADEICLPQGGSEPAPREAPDAAKKKPQGKADKGRPQARAEPKPPSAEEEAAMRAQAAALAASLASQQGCASLGLGFAFSDVHGMF